MKKYKKNQVNYTPELIGISLLELGMPREVMQRVLGEKYADVCTYLTKSRGSQWQKKIDAIDKAMPVMLKLYAQLKCNCVLQGVSFKKKLETTLAELLEEKRILQMLDCGLQSISSFRQIKYSGGFPEGYRKLIDALKPIEIGFTVLVSSTVWDDYLSKVASGMIPMSKSHEFVWGNNHFVHTLLEHHIQKAREMMAPTFTMHTYVIINEVMKELSDQGKIIIDMYFGLQSQAKTLKAIGQECNFSEVSVKRIIERLKLKIADLLNIKWYISNAWEEEQKIKENHQEAIKQLQENQAKKIESISSKNEKDSKRFASFMANFLQEIASDLSEKHRMDIQILNTKYRERLLKMMPKVTSPVKVILPDNLVNEKLFLPVDSIFFGVMAHNSFKIANIRYMWELAQYTRKDLLKLHNLGNKRVDAIEKGLITLGLTLNMKLTEGQINYFKSKTTELKSL